MTIPSGNWYHWIPCPKNVHLDTRIKSIAALCPEINANVDFKWRPFSNPIWRQILYNTKLKMVPLDSLPPKTYI